VRYVDELVLRDRDTNGNGTLDERLYALQDANYNVTAITDTAGAVVQRFGYEAYGRAEVLAANWQPAADGYDWEVRYAGYRWDGESGLYQVRFRYLHPGLGRWVSRDPLGYVDGMGLYEYAGSNPFRYLDPTGLGIIDWIVTGEWDPDPDVREAAHTGWIAGWGSFGVFDGSIGQWLYTGDWNADPDVLAAAVNSPLTQDFEDCWKRCMSQLNHQAAAAMLGAGAGISATTPVDKVLAAEGLKTMGYDQLAKSFQANAANPVKRTTTSSLRIFSALSREISGNGKLTRALHGAARGARAAPVKAGAGMAAAGIALAEGALGAYCAKQCHDCPTSY
jgi:RHS repeat-associated protein